MIQYKRTKGEDDMLNGFKVFDFSEGAPYVSITRNGITFNKAVLMKMGCPRYALLLINDEAKQIAVQAAPESEPKAVPFFKEKKSGLISVRWNGKDLMNTIAEMMDWDLDKQSYRVDGTLIKEDNAMLFDFNQAKLINSALF